MSRALRKKEDIDRGGNHLTTIQGQDKTQTDTLRHMDE